MLSLLSLKDFVIVRELHLDVTQGLTTLTGETGAGKSILIDAIELVLGGRGDSGLIREGAERAEICAEFVPGPRAQSWMQSSGLSCDGVALLRRTIDRSGRSRSWINGTPVTLAQIRELGERLIDIHGQNAHQSLLKPAFQLRLLDDFGAHRETVLQVRRLWDDWQARIERLREATEDQDKLAAEAERLQWRMELLAELSPKQGEWQEISEEHTRMSNSAGIIDDVRAALDALTNSEDCALRLLSQAEMRLSSAGKYDPQFEQCSQAISEAYAVVSETVRQAERHLEHCDMDEEHFAQLDERLNAYWKLSRKFHRVPEELFELYQSTRERLDAIESSYDIDALQLAAAQAEKAYRAKAQELTDLRLKAAGILSDAVTEKMQSLAMSGGCLEIALTPTQPWAGGLERVEFLVSGHAGATPRPLTRVASGGELARISLAIAVITAEITPVPTLIFDEVDTGIGGAVAEIVGRLLRRLGKSRQVLCITHLPQVASAGHTQWQVEKHTIDGVTESSVHALSDSERISEIARMLGGVTITDTTRCNAAELLEAAQND